MFHGEHVTVIWSPKKGYKMFYIFDDMYTRDVLEIVPCHHVVSVRWEAAKEGG